MHRSRKRYVPPRSRYHYQRQRQQRLAIVILAGLALIVGTVSGLYALVSALWPKPPAVMATSPVAPAVPAPPSATSVLAIAGPERASLLYHDPMEWVMASRQLEEKLMPVTPAFEDAELKNNLAALFAEYPAHFRPHLYYYNPTTGASVDINGYEGVSAASVIKLPVLLQFFRMVDRGLISPDSSLLYTDFLRGGGAGELQYKPSGEVYSAREIATRMIQISDNTCTNMMVYSLGGIERVRQAWDSLGLKRIAIRNWLPDLEGTNIVSPYELVTMLYNLDQGLLLRPESREAALEILKGTHNRRLLPARLPEGTIIAHKTGDIGTVLGDAGIVFLPETNHRYFVSIQVERPYNDYTARDIIQRASRMIYDRAWATRSESPAAGQTTSSLALSPSSQSL